MKWIWMHCVIGVGSLTSVWSHFWLLGTCARNKARSIASTSSQVAKSPDSSTTMELWPMFQSPRSNKPRTMSRHRSCWSKFKRLREAYHQPATYNSIRHIRAIGQFCMRWRGNKSVRLKPIDGDFKSQTKPNQCLRIRMVQHLWRHFVYRRWQV